MRNYICVLCAALTVGATVLMAQSPQKPGKWQMTIEMTMPGMPMKIPAITTDVCLTEKDLADPQKAVPVDPKSDCTVSDYTVKGKTTSWSLSCPKQQMNGTGEITYAGDTYTGGMKMKVGEQEMNSKYSGKWLGACTK